MRLITFRQFRECVFNAAYFLPSWCAMFCFRLFIGLLPAIMAIQAFGGAQKLPRLFLLFTWPAYNLSKLLARSMGALMLGYGTILLFLLMLGRNYTEFSTIVCEYIRLKKK